MNTRRKFLLTGSMATTAFLTAKPFKTLANTLSPVTGYSINDNKVVLVHTGNYKSMDRQQIVKNITSLKQNIANLVLLNAGNTIDSSQLGYDALISSSTPAALTANEYSILYKGNIKIGVITANEAATGTLETINSLATQLKKEKGCHMVVYLSQLGFKSGNTLDDITLAAGSTHLDIIIGGHANNFCKQPNIALNKNKEEVIIHHAADQSLALRKIEIEFDSFGKKKHIAFTRTVPGPKVS